MSDSSITPNFAGELQFAGWTDSHTSGPKVAFWLQSAEDLEAFRSLTARKGNQAGHRFMAVFVEVGDDEKPVPPPVVGNPISEKPKGGALSKLAGVWCADPEFQSWLWESADYIGEPTPEECAETVRAWCRVESRADLDHDEAAAERFTKLIRGPYMKYMLARGGNAK
jgi:hypothetical protein